MARIWLIAGSLLLAGTAAFHLTGLDSASQWLDGLRGRIVALLWASAAINWIFVALIWTFAAIRPSAALRWPVWLTAMIPAVTGLMLLLGVDAGHPGGYMLIGSSVLAAVGGWRLR
jgi:hypothetical protein